MKFAIVSFASMASAMCAHGTTLYPRDVSPVKRAEPAFGYEELRGPLAWHQLSTANKACAVGKTQSPINLDAGIPTVAGTSFSLNIPTASAGADFENLGTTVEVILTTGTMLIGRKQYTLRQFHFHTPSEHHLNAGYFPAETHFVFQAADAAISVIGFFLEVSTGEATNPLIETALAKVRSIPANGNVVKTAALDFTSIKNHINANTVYRYGGSLTTPPCTEGVTFNVVSKPLFISPATYRALKDIVKFNSRYTQNKPEKINLLDNARNVLNAS